MRAKGMKIVRSKAGITLVETMASVLLFALVVGAILNVSVQSMTMGKRSEFAYTAYNLAKNHIETLRSLPFSNLTNAAETDTYIDSAGAPNADGPYIRTTSVTTSYTGDPNLVQINVIVTYMWQGA